MEEEIMLVDLFSFLLKYIKSMILLMIVGALCSFAYMKTFVVPEYFSESQLIVNQVADIKNPKMQYNEFLANVDLVNTYRDIITSNTVLSEVQADLDQNITIENLRKSIVIQQGQNSQAFVIQSIQSTPELAQQVVKSTTENFVDVLPSLYEGRDIQVFVLSEASYIPERIAPSSFRYLVLGAVIGLILGIGLAFYRDSKDDTIKGAEWLGSIGLLNLGEVGELSKKERKHSRFSYRMDYQSRQKRSKV